MDCFKQQHGVKMPVYKCGKGVRAPPVIRAEIAARLLPLCSPLCEYECFAHLEHVQ